jgi:membrane protein implicated in regulation of membrane protease activity
MAPTRILGTIFLGVCAIILCGGLVAGNVGPGQMIISTGCLVVLVKVFEKFTQRRAEESGLSSAQAERIEERLADLERRLTDIQEVQISLSEKSE